MIGYPKFILLFATLLALNLLGPSRARPSPSSRPANLPALLLDPRGAESVVFVVDMSGSLFDDFQVIRATIKQAVSALEPRQHFNVLLFSESRTALASTMIPADEKGKQLAFAFIDKAGPHGSGFPFNALADALDLKPRRVILLTDGVFEDERSAMTLVAVHALPNQTRLDILFVCDESSDEAKHLPFLKRLAERTGGTCRHVPANRLKDRTK